VLLSGPRTPAARIVSNAAIAIAAVAVQTPSSASCLHVAPLRPTHRHRRRAMDLIGPNASRWGRPPQDHSRRCARNDTSAIRNGRKRLARVVLLGPRQEEPAMFEHQHTTDGIAIETTLWELAHAIREVSSSDEEAFAVLEWMIAEGRISVCATSQPATAA
jgi:hypothetical protein